MINRPKLLGAVRKSRAHGFNNQPLRVIVLWHFPEGASPKSVTFWDMEDPEVAEGNDDQLVSKMIEICEADMANLSDRQDYAFCFYFGDASPDNPTRGYGVRVAVRLYGTPSFDDSASDPGVVGGQMGATPQGLAKLATSFSTDLMRLVVPAMHENMRMLQSQVLRLEAQNASLMEQHNKLLILNEKMISRKFQRDLMLQKYKFWEEQKAKAAELLFSIAPAVLMGFAGRPMLPSPPPTEQIFSFEDFVRSVQEDTDVLMALQQRLKPMQLPAVMQMVSSVQSGQRIHPAVLKSFLESVDEPQMDEFKKILKSHQWEKLTGAIRAAMREYEEAQQRVEQAKQKMDEDETAEEPIDL